MQTTHLGNCGTDIIVHVYLFVHYLRTFSRLLLNVTFSFIRKYLRVNILLQKLDNAGLKIQKRNFQMLRIVTFIPGKLDMDFSGLCVLMCTCKTYLNLLWMRQNSVHNSSVQFLQKLTNVNLKKYTNVYLLVTLCHPGLSAFRESLCGF